MKIYKNQNGVSAAGILLVIVLLVIIGAGAWYIMRDDTSDDQTNTNTTTTQDTSSNENVTPASASLEVTDNAKYIYEGELASQGANRYSELQSKGYVTEDFASKTKDINFDLLTCSQDTPSSYTYGEVEDTADTATLPVTATFGQRERIITTQWIKQNNQWKIDNVVCPTS